MSVRGRNLVTGLPKSVEVTSEDCEEALRESTMQIVEAVHSVLEKTPPELAADYCGQRNCPDRRRRSASWFGGTIGGENRH